LSRDRSSASTSTPRLHLSSIVYVTRSATQIAVRSSDVRTVTSCGAACSVRLKPDTTYVRSVRLKPDTTFVGSVRLKPDTTYVRSVRLKPDATYAMTNNSITR